MGGGNGGVGMDHYRNDAGKMSGRGIWIKEGHSRVDGGDAGDGPGTDLGMLAAPPPSGYPRKPCLVEGGVTPEETIDPRGRVASTGIRSAAATDIAAIPGFLPGAAKENLP